MFKVAITSRIRQKMSLVLGANFDESKFSVFECIANDDQPITGTTGLYKNATMSATFLSQMAATGKTNYVPMIELHDEYTKLPVGRIFDTEVMEGENGSKDLHVLFYVPADNKPDSLDQKLQSGIVNAVSSGSYTTKLLCSTCGFDLTASEETIETLLWERKCGNGHILHKDMHIVMSELKSWDELSFVTQGAVPRAKILSEQNQKLSKKTDLLGLAARANIDKLRFNATTSITPEPTGNDKGKKIMSKIELEQSEYATLIKAEGKVESLESQLTAEKNTVTKLSAEKSNLEAEKTSWEAEKATLAQAKADLEAEKTAWETEKATLNSKITSLQTQLATAGIPEGGASNPANGGDQPMDALDAALFKRNV